MQKTLYGTKKDLYLKICICILKLDNCRIVIFDTFDTRSICSDELRK